MRIPLNFMLLLAVVACALLVVNANHQARKLFIALDAERRHAKDLSVEWDQLQLEQSTWADNARVEKLARDRLGMKRPAAGEVMSAELATQAAALTKPLNPSTPANQTVPVRQVAPARQAVSANQAMQAGGAR
ncbi:MAG: cell division protein FtsL [Rugosibacter sp.]|jgi:cell division protein FtsL|nr:cell division protein FtsL [Rugosibacter sp.]